VEPRYTPVNLTRDELAIFNSFWQSLNDADRQILSEILESMSSKITYVDKDGYPIPFITLLLALLIEEHKLSSTTVIK
jgi:hypothetical protein